MIIMSLRLSLSVSVITLAVATPVYAMQSPVLRVRQGNFATGIHRVVLDMTRLPNALPTVAKTATGWTVNFEDRDGRSLSTAVTVPRGQAVTRTFYLAKTKSRPARLVVDFVAAQTLAIAPIETTAAPAPIMTRAGDRCFWIGPCGQACSTHSIHCATFRFYRSRSPLVSQNIR
jgi:hypothetical protein